MEHSEVRAEAALVTILSLTQVTELKLLLDCGPDSHRFYGLVLSLLVTTIILEVLVGAVVIYIGGIHRAKPPKTRAGLGRRCTARQLVDILMHAAYAVMYEDDRTPRRQSPGRCEAIRG